VLYFSDDMKVSFYEDLECVTLPILEVPHGNIV